MKLYLSSYRIPRPDKLVALIGKPADQTKVAIIPNAKDYYANRARAVKLRDQTDYITNLGFTAEIVDLRDYRNSESLRDKLQQFDALWLIGGNTYCLRYEIEQSGFNAIIGSLLQDGITFIGESAGACVAGTNLRGLESADNPEFAEGVIYDGLGLVNNTLSPHADNAMFAEDITNLRELYKDDPTFLELKDSEALIVNDTEQEIVSA